MPVARCFSCTAEEVLLIFCPPGPVPQRKASVKESSGSSGGRGGMGLRRHGWDIERARTVVKAGAAMRGLRRHNMVECET